MDPIVKKFLMDKYLMNSEDENLAPVPLRDEEAVAMASAAPVPASPSPAVEKKSPAPQVVQPEPAAPAMEPMSRPTADYSQRFADDDLSAAQGSMQEDLKRNNMMRAFSTIGGAIAGVKPDNSFYDNMDKQAGLEIQNLKERRKFEIENIQRQQLEAKTDPDSAVSQNTRAAYKKFMPGIVDKIPNFDSLSAFDIEENLAKPFDLYQRAEDRRLQLEAMSGRVGVTQSNTNRNFELKQTEIAANKRAKVLEAYNKDPNVRKLRERQDMANNAEALLAMKNPVADEAVGTQLARMAGEVGNLTENDIARFKGSPDLISKAKRFASKNLVGRITDNDRKALKEMVRIFRQKNQENEVKTARQISKQYGQAFEMDEGDLLKILVPSASEAPAPKSAPQGAKEVERVTKDGRTAVFDAETKQFLRFK